MQSRIGDNLNCPPCGRLRSLKANDRRSMSRFQSALVRGGRRDQMLALARVGEIARLDVGRQARKGIPEVILAEGKDPEDVGLIARKMLEKTGSAIISRASPSHLEAVRNHLPDGGRAEYLRRSHIILVRARKGSQRMEKARGGRVGILTAGTSDISVAEEAMVIAQEMGSNVRMYQDVGVAGLHRLFQPLKELLRWDADILLVVAGREGALPTVVAGLVDIPVIGVPTSRSYGFGEKGIAALAAMLQACSLGLTVVNIDGGVGAGAVAALTANRMANLRVSTRHKHR